MKRKLFFAVVACTFLGCNNPNLKNVPGRYSGFVLVKSGQNSSQNYATADVVATSDKGFSITIQIPDTKTTWDVRAEINGSKITLSSPMGVLETKELSKETDQCLASKSSGEPDTRLCFDGNNFDFDFNLRADHSFVSMVLVKGQGTMPPLAGDAGSLHGVERLWDASSPCEPDTCLLGCCGKYQSHDIFGLLPESPMEERTLK